jgi:large subunit ribosomal protein L5
MENHKGIEKIVLNYSSGRMTKEHAQEVEENLRLISGQKPVSVKAKKSVSNFKVRKGQTVGMKVTIRKEKAVNFFNKLL